MKSLYPFLSRVKSASNTKLTESFASALTNSQSRSTHFVKSLVVSLAILFAGIGSAFGQVNLYTFAQTAGTYADITGGTVLITASSNTFGNAGLPDEQIYNITIPFTFTFNGAGYTSLNISANGFVTFGPTAPTGTNYTPISSAEAYAGAISAWGRDLSGMFNVGGRTSTLRWQAVGVAPNREVVIQFKNWRPTYSTSGTTAPFFDFQIRLKETSNIIDVIFGPSGMAAGTANTGTTAQVGLRGANNTFTPNVLNRTNATTLSVNSSTAGTTNASMQAYSSVNATPGSHTNGKIYRWTPPAPPACAVPSALTSSGVTNTSATISWTAASPAPASGYEYFYSTSATAPTAGTTPSGSTAAGVVTANITGLTANTTYYFWVRSNCGGSGTSTWAGSSTFFTGYCTPSSSSVDGTGITNVTFGTGPTVNNTTGAEANNYGNYSAQIGGLAQSSSATISMTFNTATYPYTTGIYVDWNNDLDFADAGELVWSGVSGAVSPNTLVATFTVPGSAVIGANYRMRIGGDDSGVVPAACATGLTYACFEDYTIIVTAPPSCISPTALISGAITSTTATISWTAASPAPASGYQYYVSTSSTAPLAGTTPTGSVGAGITTANLTGLTANTTYYYWVRGNCGGSGSSTWVGSSNFFTGVTNNIPFSGSSSVACGTSTLIYDHAGASTDYSINANGYIVLNNNVGSTSVISLTGTYTTELSWDFLRIYDGTGTAGTLIASYSGSGTITPFTSSAGQTITVRFTSDGSTNASGISLNAAYSGSCAVPVCSGTPTPGNTISSPSFVAAPSGNVNLSLQNATVGTGVTYQWESSTSQTGTYTNIVGATSSTYTATVSSVTWFRCIVTCSGNSGTSAPVQVTLTACIPTMTYGCTDGDVIARVILNTLDNNSGTGCPSGTLGYSNYTSNPALTTTLLPSTSYNCIVYAGQYAANYAAWIDYNDNLIFEASERIGYTLSTVAGSGAIGVLGSSASFAVTLACTPAAGQHLLRIREVYNQTSGITITPCGNNEGFGYGEIEDYMITIAPAPACATPGLVSSVTPSSNSVALTWATSCSSALSYDFEYGPAGFTLGSGSGTFVSNPTVTISAPNASYTVTGLQAGTNYDIYYRANCGSSTSAWSLTSNFSTPNSVSAASSTPTLCQGTVLTSITHNTQGATGIGTATGLPAGVTATWASNTITISGTPSASGTFNYSIPLTGGFGSLNATGTITVLAAPIAPTATSPQVFCETANATIASLQVSGAAGSTFAWYTASTGGVALSSSTALSIGTTNYFVESIGTNGCVSLTRTSVSVTENPLLSASVSITGTTACPGGVLLFTSTPVNGGTNPTFQWYNNGVVIPNETASTYSASGLLAGDVINVKMIPSGSCVTVCP